MPFVTSYHFSISLKSKLAKNAQETIYAKLELLPERFMSKWSFYSSYSSTYYLNYMTLQLHNNQPIMKWLLLCFIV